MSVIVDRHGELYALLVDDVGDVLWLPASLHEAAPATLSLEWRSLCSGLYRLETELLLVLRIEEVMVLNRQGAGLGLPTSRAAHAWRVRRTTPCCRNCGSRWTWYAVVCDRVLPWLFL